MNALKKSLKRILPSGMWNALIAGHRVATRVAHQVISALGYNIVRRADYYSPLPVVSELKANLTRWYKPSQLAGIEFDVQEFKRCLLELLSKYYGEYSQYPDYHAVAAGGFGPGYTAVDALVLYMMIRDKKPRRYIEIGSGVSTYYCSLAARQNNHRGYPLQIQCIEPHPAEALRHLAGVQVYADQVQNVSLSLFEQLEANDILFIDSTHILKIDGDVPYLYLEVLPKLRKGVLIHIHDIPFPYNVPYPAELWIFGRAWPVFWNEAMVLQAFLCFNRKFRIIMSAPLVRYFDEDFMRRTIPIYQAPHEEPNTFSSIWLQKVD